MRILTFLLAVVILGCAKMQVGGTEKPIKLDISMRLDIYQHVEKDIDAVESIVSGNKEPSKAADQQGLLGFGVRKAYARESLSPEIEQAALRRKNRLADLASLESKAVVGENRNGLVEIRDAQNADSAIREIVNSENSDRMIIYEGIAEKNGTSVEDVQKLYANRLQVDAPKGAPVESANGEWKIK